MLNIGNRPTLKNNKKETIEVNIFNFDEEIYDQEIKIEFFEKIRDEQKFENLSELTNQLKIDKEHVLQIFN